MNVLHVEVALNPSSAVTSAEVENVLEVAFRKLDNPVQDFQISACTDEFFTNHIYAIKFGSAAKTHRTIRFYEPILLHSGTNMANSQNFGFDFPSNGGNSKRKIEYHVFRLDQDESGAGLIADLQNKNTSSSPYFNHQILPSQRLFDLWDSLIFQSDIKSRLMSYIRAVILYTTRMVNRCLISSNQVIHLHGPPGTGKKSLCQALAQKATTRFTSHFHQGHLLEINCRCLFSKLYSDSERLIMDIFRSLDELVQTSRSIIFLAVNEVEALARCRNSASMCTLESCNCMRIVDVFLAQINRIQKLSNVVILTTSNTSELLGLNFVDRADKKMFVGSPSEDVIYEILNSSINELIRVGIIGSENHISLPSTLAAAVIPGSFNEAKSLSRIAKLCLKTNGSELRQMPFQTLVDYFEDEEEVLLSDFLAAMEKLILKERRKIDESLDFEGSQLPASSTSSYVNVSPQSVHGLCSPNNSSEGYHNVSRTNETCPSNVQNAVRCSSCVRTGNITNLVNSERGLDGEKCIFLREHQGQGPTVQTNFTMQNKNNIPENDEPSKHRSTDEVIQGVASGESKIHHDALKTGTPVGSSRGVIQNVSVCQQSLKANEQQQSSLASSISFPIPLTTSAEGGSGTKVNHSGMSNFRELFNEAPSSFLNVPAKSESFEKEAVSASTGRPCEKQKKLLNRKPKATLPVPMPILVKVEPGSFEESRLPQQVQSVETPPGISNTASHANGDAKDDIENRCDSVTEKRSSTPNPNQQLQVVRSVKKQILANSPVIIQPEKRKGLSVCAVVVKSKAELGRNPPLSLARTDPSGLNLNPHSAKRDPSEKSSTLEDTRKEKVVEPVTGNVQLTETIVTVQKHPVQSPLTPSSVKGPEQQHALTSVGKGDADLANDKEELPDIQDTAADGSTLGVCGNKQKGKIPISGKANSAASSKCPSVTSSGTTSGSVSETIRVSPSLSLPTTTSTDSDLGTRSSKRMRLIKCSVCNVSFYFHPDQAITTGRHLQVQASKSSRCEKCQKKFIARRNAEYRRKRRRMEASSCQQLPSTKKAHPTPSEQQWQQTQKLQHLTKRKQGAYDDEIGSEVEVVQMKGGAKKKSKFKCNEDETKDKVVQVSNAERVMIKPKVAEGGYHELLDFDRKLTLPERKCAYTKENSTSLKENEYVRNSLQGTRNKNRNVK